MARDPVVPVVRRSYGLCFLYFIGRAWDAANEIERALEDDPLNLRWRFDLGFCLVGAGKEVEAVTELRRILELDENYYLAYIELAIIETVAGRPAEALALIEKAYALAPWLQGIIGVRAGLLIRTGDARRALEIVQGLGGGRG